MTLPPSTTILAAEEIVTKDGKVYDLRQPDGEMTPYRVWGDEFYQIVETLDGYTVIRDPDTSA